MSGATDELWFDEWDHGLPWETPDFDFIDLDWVDNPDHELKAGQRDETPLVVLFHGLEGSSRSHYALALMRALAARGWNGCVAHFRGCSGEINLLPRAYHSGDSAEIGTGIFPPRRSIEPLQVARTNELESRCPVEGGALVPEVPGVLIVRAPGLAGGVVNVITNRGAGPRRPISPSRASSPP